MTQIINGQRRFGCWAGMPQGIPENPKCCIEEVHKEHRFYQCARPRGHGPDGLYCKQHSPEAVATRRAKADARYEAQKRQWDANDKRREIVELARKFFKQEASFDDLERAVSELERLLT